MANVITNNSMVHDSAAVTNWISQISVAGTTYDLATHHGITFKNGSTDSTGTTWNGITELTVVIPTVADLVQNPLEYVGNITAAGAISYFTANYTPNKGDILYVLGDCTFNSTACEAGDMAIYDGKTWQIVSGENQVKIVGIDSASDKTFTLDATAKDVLTVAGKTLKLNVDYLGIKDVLSVEKNGDITVNLLNGSATVSGKYVALSMTDGGSTNIATEKSIELPNALASGAVTINENVLTANDFTWSSGTLPAATSNANAIDITVDKSFTLSSGTAGASGDFVANISGSVMKGASLTSSSTSGDIEFLTSVALTDDNKVYVSEIREMGEEDDLSSATFRIPGAVSVDASHKTFVSGFGNTASSGEVVSSITVGTVSLSDGSDIVTGLSTATSASNNGVITAVNFGSVAEDYTKTWFVTGISGSASKVVTDVALGDISLASDSSSSFKQSVMISAVVSGNVLSFDFADAMKPVKVSQPSFTVTSAELTKGGVKLDGQGVQSAAFTKKGIHQAATEISYKSLLTNDVVLTQASAIYYKADTAKVQKLSLTNGYASLGTEFADVTKNSYSFSGDVSAKIPANKVLTGFDAGTLPSWAVGAATGTLTGSVSTALSTSNVSWYAVNPDASVIALPDTYSLVSDSTISGAIEVAAAGEYSVSGNVTIASNAFVTNVFVSDVQVTTRVSSNPE